MMNPAVQRFQKRMLQFMLACAMGLLIWGLVRLELDGLTHARAMAEFAQLDSPAEVITGTIRAEPVALLCFGISVLVLTPFVRLAVLALDFLVQRDWLYLGMSVVVGVIVIVGFLLRMH